MSTKRFVLTELTFDAIMAELEKIVEKVAPNWDFNDANDLGRLLTEIGVGLSEANNAASNTWALEAFIGEARDPTNIYLLAAAKSYRPRTAQPSTVLGNLVISGTYGSNITILAGKLSVNNSNENPSKKFFENAEDITIPVGQTFVNDISMIEGQTKVLTFTADGTDFFSMELPESNVIIDELPGTNGNYGIIVDVDGDDTWSLVSDFLYSEPTDKHFILQPTHTGGAKIVLGDNNAGAKPVSLAAVTVTYRVGGGDDIIERDDINTIVAAPALPGGLGYISFNNSADTAGGDIAESLTFIQKGAVLLGNERTKLMDEAQIDFFVKRIAGVARSKVTFLSSVISIAVIPDGGGIPSTELFTKVATVVRRRVASNYDVLTQNPTYSEQNLNITGYLKSAEITKLSMFRSIRDLISDSLNPLAQDSTGEFINEFGDALVLSDLNVILKEIPFLFDYKINTPAADIALNPTEITTHVHTRPRRILSGHASGETITITIATLGTWGNKFKIEIIDAATSGLTETASVLVEDLAGSDEIIYTISLGSNAGQSSINFILDFINSDPLLLFFQATILTTGEEIYETIQLVSAIASADSNTDDSTWSFNSGGDPYDMDLTAVTNFDITLVAS